MDPEFDDRFSGIENRLDRSEVRLDGIDSRLDGIDSRLDGMDSKLDSLANRVENEAQLSRNRYEALLDEIAKVQTLEAPVLSLATSVKRLEANAVTKKEFSDLQHSMLHLAKHVETMMESFAGAHRSLEFRFDSEIEEIKRRLSELEKRFPPQAA